MNTIILIDCSVYRLTSRIINMILNKINDNVIKIIFYDPTNVVKEYVCNNLRGYEIICKNSPIHRRKTQINLYLACDAIEFACFSSIDHIAIMAGAIDSEAIFAKIREKGKFITVISADRKDFLVDRVIYIDRTEQFDDLLSVSSDLIDIAPTMSDIDRLLNIIKNPESLKKLMRATNDV